MYAGAVLMLGGLASLISQRHEVASSGHRAIWAFSGVALLVLGAVRLFGWDGEFAQAMRLESINHGWYQDRRPAQFVLIVFLSISVAAIVIKVLANRSTLSATEKLMVGVVFALAGLLAVRAVSYHWTDQLFGLRGGNRWAPGTIAIWFGAALALALALRRVLARRATLELQDALFSAVVVAVVAAAFFYPKPHLNPERPLSRVDLVDSWDADGFVSSGGAFREEPLRLDYSVPAGSQIVGALLYWSGEHTDSTGDGSVLVDGRSVTGTRVGGPTYFYTSMEKINESAFRADVTNLVIGRSSVSVSGASFDELGGGAGLFVFYKADESAGAPALELRDGLDLAFENFKPPLDAVVPQQFTLAPSGQDRSASLTLMVSGLDSRIAGALRPSVVDVRVGAAHYTFQDQLGADGSDGWDLFNLSFLVPSGATSLEVTVLSEGGGSALLPASFAWVLAGLQVQPRT
ncbi:MAG: hypothetical protein AB7N24_20700 [Dehalococcoidia bacterium]